MPFQPATLTLLRKVLFHIFSVRFVHFWKFLSVFLECESNGRKNTIQLIYDCRWRGQQSAKNRQTEQQKLRTDFFGVIWSFPRSCHGRVPEKLTGNWRKSFLRHQLIINASSDGKTNKTLCQKSTTEFFPGDSLEECIRTKQFCCVI